MFTKKTILTALVLCLLMAVTPAAESWVTTWASGQQLTEQSNMPPSPGLTNNTLRQLAHVTIGGSQLRIEFSNAYSSSPITIRSAHIAASRGGSSIDTATDTALSFRGSAATTIQPGQAVYSDPLNYNLPPLSNLAVTVHFGSTSQSVTGHPGSRTTSYIQSGNAVSSASLYSASTTDHWYNLSRIEVMRSDNAQAIVVLGDSISDGRGSTTNTNNRWPDNLARRLQANAGTENLAVVNQGIGGNNVLSGGLGPTARQRFDNDVLSIEGVRWLLILEGVNDIGSSHSQDVAYNLISAYEEFITKAHANNILVYGIPILPFGGSQYSSSAHESARQIVNDWIRTSGKFDAVLDLDEAVRDPYNQANLNSSYDSGDHLHLNVAGYRKMADAIDLALFETEPAGICGDVNGSGTLTIVDALMIAQYSVGLTLNQFNAALADVNGDGRITIVDALQIAQCTVGIRSCDC